MTLKQTTLLALSIVATLAVAVSALSGPSPNRAAAQGAPVCISPDQEAGAAQEPTPRCIIIVKDVIGGSGQSFSFQADAPPGPGTFELADGEEAGYLMGLTLGDTYEFTENVPSGWQVQIQCVGAGVTFSISGATVIITEVFGGEPFDYAICTFTNRRAPTPTPTATSTPAPTATPTPVIAQRPNLGGIFGPLPTRNAGSSAGQSATSPPTGQAAGTISPPSTGDGGQR
jgi:hypothetical protein